MRDNYDAINSTRQKALNNAESQRISEIVRLANGYQAQGLTRTQALQLAERGDPEGFRSEVNLTIEQGAALGFRPAEEDAAEEASAPRG